MKKTKSIAVMLTAVLLLVPFMTSAHALSSSLFEEGGPLSGLSDALAELFGGNTPGGNYTLADLFTNPNGVLDDIRQRIGTQLDNSALIEAITNVLGGDNNQSFSLDQLLSNDFLNNLRSYLGMQTVPDSTTAPTAPPTYTNPPTAAYTNPPTAYSYVTTAAPATVTVPTGTRAAATTTTAPSTEATSATDAAYSYVPPATVTVPELTSGAAFTPSVTEDAGVPAKGSTGKTVVGVLILLLSLGAVVAVAVVLRKTAI